LSIDSPSPRRFQVAQQLRVELDDDAAKNPKPWHAVVCSRFGRDLIGHRTHLAMHRRFIEQAVARGEQPLVVRGTAAEPWSLRTCELLHVDPVILFADEASDRDQLAIELADRVDATYVRDNGKIMRLLCERLARDPTPTVEVLVTATSGQVARELIARGAIGYWINLEPKFEGYSSPGCESPLIAANSLSVTAASVQSLVKNADRWLVHSTRARTGEWPGESHQQFIDRMLLSTPANEPHSPLETLERIVRDRRLVGSCRTVSSEHPVVCFSALPIHDWLARRTFRPHLGRWDAEPYGIAICRTAAARLGIQPVIYGDKATRDSMDHHDLWKFQSTGSTYDWTGEQEWRGRGVIDLTRFEADQVVVFVKTKEDAQALNHSPWPILVIQD
jgi:hypothetical protein